MAIHASRTRGVLASVVLASPLFVGAATQVLYDPAATGPDPALAGWLAGGLFFANATYSSAGVALSPLIGNESLAGFSNYLPSLAFNPAAPKVNVAFPMLDSAVGYRLSFGMDLDTESHSGNANRAGFSVTLIGQDRRGVEIGFQHQRIFAQSLVGNSFVAAEETTDSAFLAAAFAPNRWDLTVTGASYALSLGNQTVLSGSTRDFSSYSGNGQNAYRSRDFVFFGDNTGSAQSAFTFSYAALTTPVPEPGQAALLAAGLLALAGVRRRRRLNPDRAPCAPAG